ncbi:MAG: carboxypeptidase-like regulatory domain-containing protein [Acidobacteriota bacterium]|nr:carboxypeptidase-like regulatory domain-containing protein [Acidobacteriota bacterium]
MGIKKLTALLAFASVLVFFSGSAFAQSYRAQVRGSVIDQSGAAIPAATATLLNVKTGTSVVKQTDSAGLYVFDFVDPGTYTLAVDAPGFGKYLQENISVQSGGDVTVNATLNPGALQQSVTVEAAPPAVEFNSTNQELTIDTKMANDTPRLDRNPFKLTLLEPAAVNTRGEMQPYQSWAANSVDLGGDTNLKNDLLVDGSPIGIGHKAGYPPNQDDVQESVVSQNSVDAASGHSAGGAISLTTKGGTNEWHGTAFYLGRYPWLSAQADRTRFVNNAQRQNMVGGTFSNPILKNKLFNFFSVEDWKIHSPGSYSRTVPTAAERSGDFSHTYAADGTLRVIYDPFSTVVDPTTGAVSRTPFPNNVIPSSRFDPLSAKLAGAFFDGNNPGVGYNHQNNYLKSLIQTTSYYNFSDRVDYNISDKWRVSGYFGRYYSDDSQTNPISSNSVLYQPAGSLRIANQVLGDAVWSITPNTVVNFHGDWFNLVDAYVSKGLGKDGWSSIWPGNSWYAPYLNASANVPLYYPTLNIGGNSFGGPGFFWDQRPAAESFSAQVSQTKGSHYLKYGVQFRRGAGANFVSNTNNFNFNQGLTANTFNNPDLTKSGDPFATFLLGALDSGTQMVGGPSPITVSDFYGFYIGDDWKVSRNLTINLGLRDEYETAWHDPNHQLSQGLDLNSIDPAIKANPPQMPASVTNIVGANYSSFAGLWNFTSSSHPGMWNAPMLNLMPRFGVAYRVNDKTALRFGYALYTIPTEYNFTPAPVSGFEDVNFLEPPFFGMTGYQNAAPLLNGVPQETLSNPFPASNPLVPIAGKAGGTNVGRGGSPLLWYPKYFQKAFNNRLNVTFEHQLPGQVVTSLTYFVNFGNQQYNQALNNIDPRILQQYQGSYLSTPVTNPFYHYQSQTLLPGPLYNQQTVPLSSLLVKYPLYGPLYQIGVRGAEERYQDVELKVQKRFSQGYNFLFGYIFIKERSQINNFNDQTLYQNQLQWQDSNQPHHRIVAASTYELPFGRNKHFLAGIPRVADAVIGGWQITGTFTFTSGDYPRFGNQTVTGNPCQNVPSGDYFNPSAFGPIPANTYVLRSNPMQYSCIVGPSFLDVDATLQKNFHVTERVLAELKLSAYNATNKLNRADPSTNQSASDFGQALYQGSPTGEFGGQTATYGNQAGRQLELGFRLTF